MPTLGTIGFFLCIAIIIFLVAAAFLFGTFTQRSQPIRVEGRLIHIAPQDIKTSTADCPAGTIVGTWGLVSAKGASIISVDISGRQIGVSAWNSQQNATTPLQVIAFCSRI